MLVDNKQNTNVTRLTQWVPLVHPRILVPLVEQELLVLVDPLSSPLIFSGVRVTQSLVCCVMLVDCCLSFCLFSFDHCVVCS